MIFQILYTEIVSAASNSQWPRVSESVASLSRSDLGA